MSRERENPEQSCLLGWQEKLAPSCTARCLPSAAQTCCPTWAAFELGAESKWGLHHLQRGSVTSACPSPHFFGPGKESLSMPFMYSAPDH